VAIGAVHLSRDFDWLQQVVEAAVRAPFPEGREPRPAAPAPDADDDSAYALLLARHGLEDEDRLILLLALAPELRPDLLDPLLARHSEKTASRSGGLVASEGFWQPTVGTALFLLGGVDLERRLALLPRFEPESRLLRSGLLAAPDRPGTKGVLAPAPGLLRELATGAPGPPAFGADFPARRIETRLSWSDLILPPRCRTEIETLLAWIEHGSALLRSETGKRFFDPGFRALFTGPSGVGKTLTAALIGQRSRRPVYRVDLSLVVSKWIGETEKNLARLFEAAEGRGWILFFDEADALFGKRTETGHANDRYANQEVAYLLQRIETFDGLAILATNLKKNIDTAFIRRFQAVVRFEAPGPAERLRLSERTLAEPGLADPGLDLEALARDYEITGAGIVNALRRAWITARLRGQEPISEGLLRAAVERELVETGGDGSR
jgi:hypothetical protein